MGKKANNYEEPNFDDAVKKFCNLVDLSNLDDVIKKESEEEKNKYKNYSKEFKKKYDYVILEKKLKKAENDNDDLAKKELLDLVFAHTKQPHFTKSGNLGFSRDIKEQRSFVDEFLSPDGIYGYRFILQFTSQHAYKLFNCNGNKWYWYNEEKKDWDIIETIKEAFEYGKIIINDIITFAKKIVYVIEKRELSNLFDELEKKNSYSIFQKNNNLYDWVYLYYFSLFPDIIAWDRTDDYASNRNKVLNDLGIQTMKKEYELINGIWYLLLMKKIADYVNKESIDYIYVKKYIDKNKDKIFNNIKVKSSGISENNTTKTNGKENNKWIPIKELVKQGNFSSKKIEYIKFLDINEGKVKDWTDMYRIVINKLYEKNKNIIEEFAKEFQSTVNPEKNKYTRRIIVYEEDKDKILTNTKAGEVDFEKINNSSLYFYKNLDTKTLIGERLVILLEKFKESEYGNEINPDTLLVAISNKGEEEAGEKAEGESVDDNLELAEDLYVEYGLSRNRIVFGAPGTGKSHRLEKDRQDKKDENGNIIEERFSNDERYERVTFHPSYSYSNFVGTYKPVSEKDEADKDTIKYKYVAGPFLRILAKALAHPENNYLLLIEEINRANVAAVFGDVFQLLDRNKDGVSEYPIDLSEDIKRWLKNYEDKDKDDKPINLIKKFEEIKRELEKNKNDKNDNKIKEYEYIINNKLIIPSNMYIWATMNSADQGVFPMDTAFKRRWDFEYIGINEEVENDKGEGKEIEIDGNTKKFNELKIVIPSKKVYNKRVGWNDLRKCINKQLIKNNINEDKLLGPFFLSPKILIEANKLAENEDANITSEKFVELFESKVIMYLFEDVMRIHRNEIFKFKDEKKNFIFSDICKEFVENGIDVFNIDTSELDVSEIPIKSENNNDSSNSELQEEPVLNS